MSSLENKLFLTGIPRSGTTLCCKLLNQHPQVIALHEPINPSEIDKDVSKSSASDFIDSKVKGFSHAIEYGLPFEHGDKGGLGISNPIGDYQSNGVRQVVAKRGEVQLAPRKAGTYTLVIKQNALFTALLSELKVQHPIVCIVRNPVDVLLSWWTVNLPVNRGRIPAGERFAFDLAANLSNQNVLSRQFIIYQWFIEQYVQSGLPIVKYEEVIASDGNVLDRALGLSEVTREPLSKQSRYFESHILTKLEQAKEHFYQLKLAPLYQRSDIDQALARHLG